MGGDMMTPALLARAQAIRLVAFDVDGVMTDGTLFLADDGQEFKGFNSLDGHGLKMLKSSGVELAIITGRSSRVVERRAAELGIAPVVQGAPDKYAAYRQILAETGLTPRQACFLGDDLPDLPVLADCGLAVAVADACPDVIAHVHHVTRAGGGRGAVREVIELILRCQGHWRGAVEHYLRANSGRG